MSIGKLEPVELRELWLHDERDFSIWLRNNVAVLSEALGLSLTAEEQDKSVGPFTVDLIARDADGDKVIIESQLSLADDDHLGKLLTCLVNLASNVAIWIVKEARLEHVRVVSWLNEISPSNVTFYLVELKAYRIADSDPAPLFTAIVKPSESNEVGDERKKLAEIDLHRYVTELY